MPGQFTDGVLETNQRRDLPAIIRKLKNSEIRAGVEIFGNLVAHNFGEEREGMPERHKFAKRHQMNLAVKLRLVLRRNQQSGVVDLMRSLLDRAEQYIKSVRTADLADKIKCFLIFENGRWHCAFGPDQEIDVRCGCESYFTQARKFIKDCLLITDIEFFRARDRRLYQSYM